MSLFSPLINQLEHLIFKRKRTNLSLKMLKHLSIEAGKNESLSPKEKKQAKITPANFYMGHIEQKHLSGRSVCIE